MKGVIFILIGLGFIGWSVFIARGARRTPKSEEGKYGRLESEYRNQEDWSKGIPSQKDIIDNNDADPGFGDLPAME